MNYESIYFWNLHKTSKENWKEKNVCKPMFHWRTFSPFFFLKLLLEFVNVCFYSKPIYKKSERNIEKFKTVERMLDMFLLRVISHFYVSICFAAAASALNYPLFDHPIVVADPETR